LFPSPSTQTSPRGERERSYGLEDSNVAVAVPASLSFILETLDNGARSYYQRMGECFSLSSGRGLGCTALELRYGVWKAQPRRGLNVNSRGCNPRCKRGNRYRPRRGRTTHDNELVRPLRGRNPFIVPIRGLPPTAIQILPLRGMKHAAKLLNSTAVLPGGEGEAFERCRIFADQ
jgi:hypothetical protein